ncbi:NAD(P)H-dependent oxidoreductase [Actinomadura miaoliensis]|uniref:NADPH-dependent FMN reductase-like domain-containing protein n=1 Tax=Actinomadura miaoliensis TaxID=430685 RepID=A0ABP7V7B6_9ACTN
MTNPSPLHVAMIIGSTRRSRFGSVVAGWFAEQVTPRADMTLDVVDLRDTRLPDTLADDGEDAPEPVRALAPRLAAADAFVVVTAEYNHSFPAPLKTAIDSFVDEWRAKPIGFVSYGGMSGGLRAVEQLRLVFSELHATTIRDTVSFPICWERFGRRRHAHRHGGRQRGRQGPARPARLVGSCPPGRPHRTSLRPLRRLL